MTSLKIHHSCLNKVFSVNFSEVVLNFFSKIKKIPQDSGMYSTVHDESDNTSFYSEKNEEVVRLLALEDNLAK